MLSRDAAALDRPLARRSADERRRLLVECAARLFERKGFDATSMQEIADEVGLAKGAVYHYIKSKQDLLYEIHNTFIEDMLDKVLAFKATEPEPAEELRFYIRNILETIHTYGHYVRVFFQELNALEPDLKAEIAAKRDEYEGLVEDCIRRGVESGVFGRAVNPKLASLFLFGACNWTYQWYRAEGTLTPDQLTDAYYTLVMEGFRDAC